MRTWRTVVACAVLAVALIVAIFHHHPTVAERSGGTARVADRTDTQEMAPATTAADGTKFR
jgi:hypothetical protein